jgi:hypothetical protein
MYHEGHHPSPQEVQSQEQLILASVAQTHPVFHTFQPHPVYVHAGQTCDVSSTRINALQIQTHGIPSHNVRQRLTLLSIRAEQHPGLRQAAH